MSVSWWGRCSVVPKAGVCDSGQDKQRAAAPRHQRCLKKWVQDCALLAQAAGFGSIGRWSRANNASAIATFVLRRPTTAIHGRHK